MKQATEVTCRIQNHTERERKERARKEKKEKPVAFESGRERAASSSRHLDMEGSLSTWPLSSMQGLSLARSSLSFFQSKSHTQNYCPWCRCGTSTKFTRDIQAQSSCVFSLSLSFSLWPCFVVDLYTHRCISHAPPLFLPFKNPHI